MKALAEVGVVIVVVVAAAAAAGNMRDDDAKGLATTQVGMIRSACPESRIKPERRRLGLLRKLDFKSRFHMFVVVVVVVFVVVVILENRIKHKHKQKKKRESPSCIGDDSARVCVCHKSQHVVLYGYSS